MQEFKTVSEYVEAFSEAAQKSPELGALSLIRFSSGIRPEDSPAAIFRGRILNAEKFNIAVGNIALTLGGGAGGFGDPAFAEKFPAEAEAIKLAQEVLRFD